MEEIDINVYLDMQMIIYDYYVTYKRIYIDLVNLLSKLPTSVLLNYFGPTWMLTWVLQIRVTCETLTKTLLSVTL